MTEHDVLALWESFYVIVGSSAAALIGLQFVVVTLISESPLEASPASLSAFGTPTVVHFGGALLISAVMSAPWPSAVGISRVLLVLGAGGLVYAGVVTRRARRQTAYQTVAEDWLWHLILPAAAYGLLLASAILMRTRAGSALFGVAATALGLLFIGIHNSWDTVTYVVTEAGRRQQGKKK
jgi:hypothetical protein